MITDTPEQEVALSVCVRFQYCAAAMEWFYRGFPRECFAVRSDKLKKRSQLLHVKFLSECNLILGRICRNRLKATYVNESEGRIALGRIIQPNLL